MNYLVIYCGGTMGMKKGPHGLYPDRDELLEALGAFRHQLAFDVFVCDPLIDSSAITLEHWKDLVALISDKSEAYAGFLLIHGTDTMAYSASLLAFALKGLNKPIVLTGSQLPLGVVRSDALVNLSDAFSVLKHASLREVVLVFNRKVMRGVGVKKIDAVGFDGFSCPHIAPLAYLDMEENWDNGRLLHDAACSFTPVLIKPDVRIGVYTLVPGATADLIGESLLSQNPDAAIIQTYGNGNAPAHDRFIRNIQSYISSGKILVNISQVLRGRVNETYAQGAALLNAGALPGNIITLESAVAKLTVILSQRISFEQQKTLWLDNWVGEFG